MRISKQSNISIVIIFLLFLFTLPSLLAQYFDPSDTDPNYEINKLNLINDDGGNSHNELSSYRIIQDCSENSNWIPTEDISGLITLPSGDDGFMQVSLPFTFTFDNTDYSSLFVNINGNISFGNGLSTYTPEGFPISTPMIAPLWSDVDTRCSSCGTVEYGFIGNNALVVTWNEVGYYDKHSDKKNTFQAVLTDGSYSEIAGNLRFNYCIMEWTTGDASGGSGGFGGYPAVAGFNAGGTSGVYLQAASYNNSSVSEFNTTSSDFNTAGTIVNLDCPNITSPTEDETDVHFRRVLEWEEVDGADGYLLTIGTSPGGSDVYNNYDIGNTTSFYTDNDKKYFKLNTTYHWKVIAYIGDTPSNCVEEHSFTTSNHLLNTDWHQKSPYNAKTPSWKWGLQKTVTGCNSTATSQIMNYYNWPNDPTGNISYTMFYYPETQEIKLDLDTSYYYYLPITNTSSNEVPKMIYETGVALYTQYRPGGFLSPSSSNPLNNLYYMVERLKFKNTITLLSRKNKSKEDFLELIQDEILNNRPLLFYGYKSIENNSSGHMMVIDGYDTSTQKVHINMGWADKLNNKYYDIDSIEYNYKKGIIRFIEPNNVDFSIPPTYPPSTASNSQSPYYAQASLVACPTLIYPQPGDTIPDNNLELIWNDLPEAVDYLVTIKALGAGITYVDSAYAYAGNPYFSIPDILPTNDSIEVTILPVEANGDIMSCASQILYTDPDPCGLVIDSLNTPCAADSMYTIEVSFSGLTGHFYNIYLQDTIHNIDSLISVSVGSYSFGPIQTGDNLFLLITDITNPTGCNAGQMISPPICITCPNIVVSIDSLDCNNGVYDAYVNLSSDTNNIMDMYTTIAGVNTHINIDSGHYVFNSIPYGEELIIVAEDTLHPIFCKDVLSMSIIDSLGCVALDSCSNDFIAPVLICPQEMLVTLASGECGTYRMAIDDPLVIENCPGPVTIVQIIGPIEGEWISLDDSPFDIAFQATDAHGNSSVCYTQLTLNPNPNISSSLVCNGNTNANLDESCQIEISAGMFLSGDNYGCFLTDYNVYIEGFTGDMNDSLVNIFAGDYAITVENNDGNSCTSIMTVEDKLAPTPNCMSVETFNITDCTLEVNASDLNNGSFDNCTSMENLQYTFEDGNLTKTFTLQDVNNSPISTNVYVIDESGNSDFCTVDLTFTSSFGMGSMACASNVNVNLDNNCQVEINAEMFLLGDVFCPLIGYNVYIEGYNGNVNGTIVTIEPGNYGVTVENTLNSNNCWSFVNFEDNLPPIIECNCPVGNTDTSCEISCFELDSYDFPFPIVTDCSGYTIVSSDAITGNICGGQTLTRISTATDYAGNSSSCTQEYTIVPMQLTDIVNPVSIVEMTCGSSTNPADISTLFDDPTTYDNPNTSWTENNEGYAYAYPHYIVNGHAQKIDNEVCSVHVSYSNQLIPLCNAGCSGSAKTIRTWTYIDWCTNETSTSIQIIEATDNEGPTIEGIEDIIVYGPPNTCEANVCLPAPILSDNCGDSITYTVSVDGAAPVWDADCNACTGGYKLSGLTAGNHEVTYYAEDCCGNVGEKTINVLVKEDKIPTSYCLNLALEFTNTCSIDVSALDFNKVSFDNCTDIDDLRYTFSNLPPEQDSSFDIAIHSSIRRFTLDDVANSPLNIDMYVWDESGNFDFCSVELFLTSSATPTITCPADITINCEQDIDDLSITGEASSSCDQDLISWEDITTNLNPCGSGFIIRRWSIPGGDFCAQRIDVNATTPFDGSLIVWPENNTSGVCANEETGVPSWTEHACDLIGFSSSRDSIVVTNGMKIIIHWEVINWCQYEENYPSQDPNGNGIQDGVWMHDQIVYVYDDNTPPIINNCGSEQTVFYLHSGECDAIRDDFELIASDNCPEGLVIEQISGPESGALMNYKDSPFTITYNVTDNSGNTTICSYDIVVEPYTSNGNSMSCNDIQVSLDENCSIEISAGMFLEGNDYGCFLTDYNVYIDGFNGNVNGELMVLEPGNYSSTVENIASMNSCWSNMTVEDKLPPIISCACPPQINTPDSCKFKITDFVNMTMEPTVIENCSDYTTSFIDMICGSYCENDKKVIRTWQATDASGNSASCVQEFILLPLEPSDIISPNPIVEISCGLNSTPEDLISIFDDPSTSDNVNTPWIENNEGTPYAYPYYEIQGHPQKIVDTLSNLIVSYSDQIINVCGPGCNGNIKTIRTWTYFDYCTSESQTSLQIVKSIDNEGPTIDGIDDFTGCPAGFYAPLPVLNDNCDEDIQYSLIVNGAIVVWDSLYNGGGYFVTGLTLGEHEIVYTSSDCCGNTSENSIIVTVEDFTPPTINCPSAIERIVLDGDCGVYRNNLNLQVSDDCIGELVIEQTSGPLPYEWMTEEDSPYHISYKVTDANGNSTTCTFDITVKPYPNPNTAMACGNQIQVSINENCELDITSELFLVGGGYGCYDTDYNVYIEGVDGNVNNTSIDLAPGSYTVTVVDILTENSCWSTLVVENKQAPIITCDCPEVEGESIADTCKIKCYELGIATIIEPSVIDCSLPLDIFSSDELLGEDCEDQFIRRTWTVTNNIGMTSTCVQLFEVEKVEFADILNPQESVILTCGSDVNLDAIVDRFDDPATDNNEGIVVAYPHYIIDGKAYRLDNLSCNIVATSTDQVIEMCNEGCDGNRKIIRRWTYLDWCTNEFAYFTQIIEAVDKEVPTFQNMEDIYVSTNPWGCQADFCVPKPQLHDNCTDNITYSVAVSNVTTTWDEDCNNGQGGYVVVGLDKGIHELTYYAEDCCGNVGEYTISVFVEDHTPPVAVALQNVVVSLTTGSGGDGIAKLFANSIDNGSFDGCSSVLFEIRREEDSCGFIGNTTYNNDGHPEDGSSNPNAPNYDNDEGQWVKFCCEDLTDVDENGVQFGLVNVWLRVWDINGNYNETWSTVRVEDKLAPAIICPADIEIYCDMDPEDLSVTGEATTYSTCGTVTSTWTDVIKELDACGSGFIIRRWSVPGGGFCDQRIDIKLRDPFNGNITWPQDIPDATCLGVAIGEPTWSGSVCDLIGHTNNRDTFVIEEGGCYKILVHWTVIDWCQYEEGFPQQDPNGNGLQDGIWKHTQIVKVVDDNAPSMICKDITFEADDTEDADQDGNICEKLGIQLTNVATDEGDCPSAWLKWNVSIDTWNDGTIDYEYSSFVDKNWKLPNNPIGYIEPTASGEMVSVTLPEGIIVSNYNHTVRWKVTDGCGNVTSCSSTFKVVDQKAPTPYCLNLSTALMEAPDCTVDIWAIDFNKGAFDNCTEQENLRYTFGLDPIQDPTYDVSLRSSSRTFTKDDIANSPIDIDMYVWDENGNYDFCTVKLTLISNHEECGTNSTIAMIAGDIVNEEGTIVDQVVVSLKGVPSELNQSTGTTEDGYAFENILLGYDYTLSGKRNTNYLEGVSTLDLLLIQRHILKLKPFKSPYDVIAADVDYNKTIDAKDLIELRKLILGKIDVLPNNESWLFIDANQSFEEILHPWPILEELKIDSLLGDRLNEDLVAVKVGDVNGSVYLDVKSAAQSERNDHKLWLKAKDQIVEKDTEIGLTFYGSNFTDLMGFQANLALDGLVYKRVESGVLNLSDNNIAKNRSGINMLWTNDIPLTVDDKQALFTLVFEAVESKDLESMISIGELGLRAESYWSEIAEVGKIGMEFISNTAQHMDYSLFQNEPNPFKAKTSIKFELPESTEVDIKIYTIDGNLLYRKTAMYKKGINEVSLTKDQVPFVGMMYYSIETYNFKEYKSMIGM